VNRHFGRRVSIVHIDKPGAAITRGAALFGLNPDIFHIRHARRYYGIEGERPRMHDDEKWVIRKEGKLPMVRTFVPFIFKSQILEGGRSIPHEFDTSTQEGLDVSLQILTCSADKKPEYMDETVRRLGTIDFTVPADLADRMIVCEMEFSGPTIQVKAYPRSRPDLIVSREIRIQDDQPEDELVAPEQPQAAGE
jgi:hypothetical protein